MIYKKNQTKIKYPDPRLEIRQIMNDQFWKMEDLAEVMQISSSAVSLLLNGKLKISMTIAVQLANALGETAEYWLLQEMRYWGISEGAGQRFRAKLYAALPIREIRARGWINDSTDTESIAEQICGIYGYKRDPSIYPLAAEYLLEKIGQNNIQDNMNELWAARAKQYIGHHGGQPFNLSTFQDVEQELENIGYDDGNVRDILAVLERAGIGFYVLPRLNRMQLLGGHFMINGAPIIVYAIDGGTDQPLRYFINMAVEATYATNKDTYYINANTDKSAAPSITLPKRSATMAGAPIRKRIIDDKYYLEKT